MGFLSVLFICFSAVLVKIIDFLNVVFVRLVPLLVKFLHFGLVFLKVILPGRINLPKGVFHVLALLLAEVIVFLFTFLLFALFDDFLHTALLLHVELLLANGLVVVHPLVLVRS